MSLKFLELIEFLLDFWSDFFPYGNSLLKKNPGKKSGSPCAGSRAGVLGWPFGLFPGGVLGWPGGVASAAWLAPGNLGVQGAACKDGCLQWASGRAGGLGGSMQGVKANLVARADLGSI